MPPAALSRRTFLARAGVGAAGVALATTALSRRLAAATAPEPSIPADLLYTSAKRLARMIREKKVSAVEVTTAYLARIDAINPQLNAVVQLCRERALAEAKTADAALAKGNVLGPLHGVPCTIKDSWETAGVVSTGGTLGRKGFIPSRDSTVVARVRAAGAIMLGKTNTPEFTLSYQTSNLIYGRTSNPYKSGYQPGGSSGGAGSIVAAGGAAFDIGTDSGGSIRGPAHFNGIAGLKPTSGRVPRTGHIIDYGGWWDSYQVAGPLARWVEDLELITPIIAGPDHIDAAIVPMPWAAPAAVDVKKLRVAYYLNNGSETPPTAETLAAVTRVVGFFKDAGAACTEDCPSDLLKESMRLRGAISAADGGATIHRLLKLNGTTQTSSNLNLGRGESAVIPPGDYAELTLQFDAVRSKLTRWFSSYDLIIAPVWPTPAEPWPDTIVPTGTGANPRNLSTLTPYNNTGWPGSVVRVATSPEGLPIGLQLIARPWRDDVALAAAYFVEARTGGYQKPSV